MKLQLIVIIENVRYAKREYRKSFTLATKIVRPP